MNQAFTPARSAKLSSAVISSLALALLLGAAPARADIVFLEGNHPSVDEENILFGAKESGFSLMGQTNQTNVGVLFQSTATPQEELCQNAKGQADIFNCADTPQVPAFLTALEISAPGYTFTDFIMNPLNGSGTATVTAIDNNNAVFTYDLGNGQNYLSIFAVNGETIDSITISVAGGGFAEFKQPRISGLCANTDQCPGGGPPQLIPEPAPMALLGAALLGGLWVGGRGVRRKG